VVIGILLIALSLAVSRQLVLDDQAREDRQEQFCEAVPLAAEAGAQAVIDIAVNQAIDRGDPAAEVERIRAFGKPIRARAHHLVLAELPTCQ